jgi:hypothetical protein
MRVLIIGVLLGSLSAGAQAGRFEQPPSEEQPPAVVQPPEPVVPPAPVPQPAALVQPAPVEAPAFKATASLQDGLKVESADGNYGLQVGALLWTRFDAAVNGPAVKDEFLVPLARVSLKVHFFRPWVSVFVQPDFGGSVRLLDLELDVHPIDAIGFKVGQFITPFSRSLMTVPAKLRFGGYSVANDVFRMNRDTGAMVYGSVLEAKLEYALAVFNGNGIDIGSNDNAQLLYMARIAGTVFGAPPSSRAYLKYDETASLSGTAPPTLMLGLDGYLNKTSPTALPEQYQRAASVDAAFLFKGLFVQAEGYLEGLENVGAGNVLRFGADAQVGVFVIPGALEVSGRFGWVRLDSADPKAWLASGDAQLGWYLAGNHLKAVARYSLTDAGSAQRGFSAGWTHGVFVQLQAWL